MTPQRQISTTTHREHTSHSSHIAFTGNENHFITLQDATRLTENYRSSVPDGSALGGFFGQQIFGKLLRQQECVGIRIYLASSDDGAPTFVLVGVNGNNNDLSQGFLGTHPIMSTISLDQQMSELNSPLPVNDNPTSRIDVIFSGLENHLTTLAEASRLTRHFRESAQGPISKGGFFGKNIFNRILSQLGCVGIHIYFAQCVDGRQTFVLAGVDRMGRHYAKWPFGDDTWLCPPFCGPSNSLNH